MWKVLEFLPLVDQVCPVAWVAVLAAVQVMPVFRAQAVQHLLAGLVAVSMLLVEWVMVQQLQVEWVVEKWLHVPFGKFDNLTPNNHEAVMRSHEKS
jgi:hypothetical protein